MSIDTTYQPNAARITYEIIEGEVIIVDFDTGVYFSINSLGSIIFTWITQGATTGAIHAAIERHYGSSDAGYGEVIDGFIESLLQEGIIKRSNTSESISTAHLSFDGLSDQTKFIAPSIDKYTDMQELLLLDPIHEVNEEGWPFTQQDEDTHAA